YDAKTKSYKPTGQTFTINSSEQLTHNTTWPGGENLTITKGSPGKEIKPNFLTASRLKPPPGAITFSCVVHPWMRAYARDFDHPFAPVSGKDGSFEIKDVPADTELRLMYWHESMEKPGELMKKVTVKPSETVTEDIKVTAK